ncbi:hypothetical protein GCM10010448_06870 [Streptomyces glomeratus]|uniref:Uncharacterized protein n=1 Tax=Streptomyces glomeratus TaxID=284452 RepID=A0ABP6L216_9ACTN
MNRIDGGGTRHTERSPETSCRPRPPRYLAWRVTGRAARAAAQVAARAAGAADMTRAGAGEDR